MWHGWINGFLGVWLALAPFVRLDVPSVKLNNFFIGVLAAIVSADAPVRRKVWGSWLGLAAGVWVALSSWFQFCVAGDGYRWSNVVSGVLIFASACSILVSIPVEKHAV
jgi:hypothetical protein